jgi:vancomycin permeability regulator SanA
MSLKRILYKIFLIVVVVGVLDIGVVFGFATYRPGLPEKVDAVVVLGAAIYSPAIINRTLTALDLYKQGKVDVMVLSGGKIADRDISEAGYMKKVIDKNSEGSVSVLIDDKSSSTYENIHNTRSLLPEAKSLIIVSDSFHLARAVILAKRAGFKNVYWASPDQGYYSVDDKRYYYFREFLAMIWYLPKFLFG